MRYASWTVSALLVIVGVAVLGSGQRAYATPSGNGLIVFSVSSLIDGAHDITAAPNATGETCTASDILFPPIFPGPCAARVAPAPAGPVPDSLTTATIDLGLDLAGAFTDDLDALSYGETAGQWPDTDFDFSVGPAPGNGGVTTGAPVPAACAPLGPNVTGEAAALEAQGDMFTTAGVPAGCNVQAPSGCPTFASPPCDEATLGLIAPNPAAPGMAPLDNVDALAEFPTYTGPCFDGGGAMAAPCGVFSLAVGSATLGFAPADTFTLLPPDAATLMVPPGAPPNPPNLAAGCPLGGTACAAVHSSSLGLLAGDELDALCWFDLNGDRTADLPTTIIPTGDSYMFSLAPGSPTLVALGFGPADVLTTSPGGPVVAFPAASFGLLATDDIDGLTCHLPTTDSDGDGFTDVAEFGAPLCAGAFNDDAFDDAAINDGCPADGAAEAFCGPAIDDDLDGIVNDGCAEVGGYSEGPQCGDSGDSDADGAVNDGCPARGAAEVICGPAADDDLDGLVNDGCPSVGLGPEGANNIMTRISLRCEVGPSAPSTGWPLDLAGGLTSTDKITIQDLSSFVAPIRRYLTDPSMIAFNARWDLLPSRTFGVPWINIQDLAALTLSAPPMLGGPKAFNGPVCTDP